MQYRKLGKTGLDVSIVGMGTAQLRRVPEKQAIETLLNGFRKGINIVHVAPDYEGAEYLVSKAVSETDRKIIVCGQAYDRQFHPEEPVSHFECLFERLCVSLDTNYLDIFGIACIDDRERFGENVWGADGMVSFLQNKKEQGRLGSIFCTTHGSAAYIRGLLEKDVFDAIMIPVNLLGFHLSSSPPNKLNDREELEKNRLAVLPLAKEKNIGVMTMKVLGAGLLCHETFRDTISTGSANLRVADILDLTLTDTHIHTAIIGVKSPSEAAELADAGRRRPALNRTSQNRIFSEICHFKSAICSRCGDCDRTCSRQLPISWLLRAVYVGMSRDFNHETWEDIEYFRLHPSIESPCMNCTAKTCKCPSGLNVPQLMTMLHKKILCMAESGMVQKSVPNRPMPVGDRAFGGRLVWLDLPEHIEPGSSAIGTICLENTGRRGWFKKNNPYRAHVQLGLLINGQKSVVPIREETHPGERIHFSFEIRALHKPQPIKLVATLLSEHLDFATRQDMQICARKIMVCRSENKVCR